MRLRAVSADAAGLRPVGRRSGDRRGGGAGTQGSRFGRGRASQRVVEICVDLLPRPPARDARLTTEPTEYAVSESIADGPQPTTEWGMGSLSHADRYWKTRLLILLLFVAL